MAYRFLLEVPESLVEDANVVVNHVPDAQVLLSHASHGLGVDEGAQDLSIAAHSLRVIQAIYKWKADIDRNAPLARNRIRIALHSGDRMTVGEIDYHSMVAAIRRDQPWVERTIPKIGEHQTRSGPLTKADAPLSTPLPRETQVAVVEGEDQFPSPAVDSDTRNPNAAPRIADVHIQGTDDIATHETVTVEGIPFILLPVLDLAKPERNYSEIFGLEVIGRGNHPKDGPWEIIEPGYDVEQEAQFGIEPDYAFMRNGPLAIALQRVGRGYPLDHYIRIPEPIHLLMDMESLRRVKANVLMRSWDVRDLRSDGFIFRDPFGYTWALVGHDGEGTIR
jgi:hypothetical protein